MKCHWMRPRTGTVLLFVLATTAFCAAIKVDPIPASPQAAKLRVYVHPLTGEGK